MKNASHYRAVIVLTDVAGEHYWTEGGMFLEIAETWPVPADVRRFATPQEADREIALQLANGIHLRRRVVRDSDDAAARVYRVALVTAAGSFDVVERFTAASDQEANAYAADRYPDADWYVLDDTGRNINGGRDQE